MKIYDKNSAICTLNSLVGNLDKEKMNPNTIEVVKLFISMASDKDINRFVRTFNEVIKTTSEQFLSMPIELRGYYSEFFAKKMKKLYNKSISKITDRDFKSYCDNLFTAYCRCKILKDYQKEIKDDLYIDDVKSEDTLQVLTRWVESPNEVENKTVFSPVNNPNESFSKIVVPEEPPKKKRITRNNIQLNEW